MKKIPSTYIENLKKEHEKQIEMLLANDIEGLSIYFDKTFRNPDELHYTVWDLTGSDERSLFANIPGGTLCLTQVRSGLYDDCLLMKDRKVLSKIKLDNEELIPTEVLAETKFSRKELEKFSELQIELRK